MKLAWQNIIHDRARFSVTVLGVSFAVFLMVFQGSLLVGFLRAASRLIDASDSDIWITARGVQAFEFGTPIEGRVREMAAGVPGVLETSRVCMAFAVYRTPNGKQQVVALVGADRNAGKRFPVPDALGSAEGMSPDAVLYDVSDRDLIQVTAMPAEVEVVNRHRASIERQIEGYGAFLGVPFCLLRTEMPVDTWGLVLKKPCSSSCASTRDIQHRMCSRTLGSVFQRSMFSHGTNLRGNLARTGR